MRSNRVIVCLCLLFAACHKHVPVAALPPPTPASPTVSTSPNAPLVFPAPVIPAVPVSPLREADRAFTAGSYDEAARLYEDVLRADAAGDLKDQALFYKGMSYALRQTPGADWMRASAALKELVDQYPNSPFKPPAGLILSLHSELDQLSTESKQRDQKFKQLTTELDRLKKIDADRRKRP